MKQLEHIRLVQFYLMEREDIAIDWVTGLFGPNGSGKSSVLDAVQIALVGGNGNYATLNAQADDQSGPRGARTIRQYCLGQYGVEEGNIVRDSAVTYITLVWRDTETREPLSMGVCIAAQANRDGHEVLGRYLLPGIELAMSDHLETVDGEERPREWAAFRHQLQERARVSGQDSLFADSDRFMNAYLFALRGSGGKPAADAFRRAFRFAMRMRFDKSVDEIVRYQVLESRPIDIQKFKEVMESFRKLAELVAQVEQKIAGAEVVDKEFARAAAEARRAATWSALAADVKVEAANAGHDAATLAAESATELLAGIASDIATTTSDLEHAQNETQRVKQLRERHAAHAQHGLAQSQIAEKTGLATRSEQELTRELGYLTRVMRDAADSKLVPQATLELRTATEPVAQWNAAARPEDRTRDGLRALLKPALSIVAQALNELFHTRTDLSRRTDVAKQDVASLEENLRRVAEGRAPLTENVQRLMSALRDQGLSPTPVCDVVRITDGRVAARDRGLSGAAPAGVAGARRTGETGVRDLSRPPRSLWCQDRHRKPSSRITAYHCGQRRRADRGHRPGGGRVSARATGRYSARRRRGGTRLPPRVDPRRHAGPRRRDGAPKARAAAGLPSRRARLARAARHPETPAGGAAT